MRSELGLDPLPDDDGPLRDDQGRYRTGGKPFDINAAIRMATGR